MIKKTIKHLLIGAAILTSTSVLANTAWTDRTIRILVPSEPGGSGDTVARPLAEAITKTTGASAVVENKGGAGGVIGANLVARSNADDGSLLLFGAVHHIIAPEAQQNVSYDFKKDFKPVVKLATMPNVLVVKTDSPVTNLDQLAAAAKDNPLLYGTSGMGTLIHLLGANYSKLTGVAMEPVHYRGSNPAMVALISGGQIDLMFETMPAALAQIKAGNVRPIAITGAERSPWLPEVPTLSELDTPLVAETWYGLFAPSVVSDTLQQEINTSLTAVMQDKELGERIEKTGATIDADLSLDTFNKFIDQQITYWATAVKEAGIEK